jgi:hypothetical protein
MKFKNPQNDYVEESWCPWLYALLFCPLYFLFKGIYRHFFLSLIVILVTSWTIVVPVLTWIVYAFAAPSIVAESYLRKGWVEVKPLPKKTNSFLEKISTINAEQAFFGVFALFVVSALVSILGK